MKCWRAPGFDQPKSTEVESSLRKLKAILDGSNLRVVTFLPRGRLSEQALALGAATLKEVMEAPGQFAAMPDVARTPAEVFLDTPQAVIDLANEDADQLAPESWAAYRPRRETRPR